MDFTFAAVGVKNDEVDFSSNCGNMLAAIGPFAVDTGILELRREEEAKDVTVRIRNMNTAKIIHSTFPVANGEAATSGQFAIDGVAGTAAKIKLAFMDPGSGH